MIIWGRKSRRFAIPGPEPYPCHYCDSPQPATIAVDYTVRHLWYLFRWVSDRSYTAFCNTCQSRMAGLKAKTFEAKLKKSPLPFIDRWGWAVGLVVVAAFIAFLVAAVKVSDRNDMAYLQAPRAGDVYTIRSDEIATPDCSDCRYGSLLVVKADENGTYVRFSKQVSNQVYSANDPAAYNPEILLIPRARLYDMKTQGELLGVERR